MKAKIRLTKSYLWHKGFARLCPKVIEIKVPRFTVHKRHMRQTIS